MVRKKMVVVCDVCGASTASGTHDFISFHCLMLCSPDCHDEYRTADEERRVRKEEVGALAVGRT